MLRSDLARDSFPGAPPQGGAVRFLSHPNIVSVYDTGEAVTARFDAFGALHRHGVRRRHTVKELLSDGNSVLINEAISTSPVSSQRSNTLTPKTLSTVTSNWAISCSPAMAK